MDFTIITSSYAEHFEIYTRPQLFLFRSMSDEYIYTSGTYRMEMSKMKISNKYSMHMSRVFSGLHHHEFDGKSFFASRL